MLNRQVVHFVLIGLVNTIVYYTFYSMFLFLQLDYTVSVVFATILGVLFNFKSFGKYVFNNDKNSLIYKFIGVYVILFIVNIIFINFFYVFLNNYYVAGFLAIFPYSVISYYLNKEFVFKKGEC